MLGFNLLQFPATLANTGFPCITSWHMLLQDINHARQTASFSVPGVFHSHGTDGRQTIAYPHLLLPAWVFALL